MWKKKRIENGCVSFAFKYMYKVILTLCILDLLMHTLANNVDRNEITHNALFYKGLHYLLKQKSNLQRKKYIFLQF